MKTNVLLIVGVPILLQFTLLWSSPCAAKSDVSNPTELQRREVANAQNELDLAKIELIRATAALQSSERFFRSLLTAILGIVGFLVAVSWLWNVRISNEQIERKVTSAQERIQHFFEAKQKEFQDTVQAEVGKRFETQQRQIWLLEAQALRSFAHLWDTQKSFWISCLWWTRSAKSWDAGGDRKMAKLALESATKALEKTEGFAGLEYIAEMQDIVNKLSDEHYEEEKKQYKVAFKAALERRAKGTT